MQKFGKQLRKKLEKQLKKPLGQSLQVRLARQRGLRIVNFLHIGKTGGSAIKYALKDHLETQQYRIQLRGHTCQLKDIPVGDKVFFFLRDPIARFVSGFYTSKRQEDYYIDPWPLEEKNAFRQFPRANDLALSLSSHNPEIRESAIRGMNAIGHVSASFWDWFGTEEDLLSRLPDILYLGFQETLQEDFCNLKRILGLPQALQLPSDDNVKNKMPHKFEKNLDRQAKINLRLWYRRDYEFIEFCQSIWEDDRHDGLIQRKNISVSTSKKRVAVRLKRSKR